MSLKRKRTVTRGCGGRLGGGAGRVRQGGLSLRASGIGWRTGSTPWEQIEHRENERLRLKRNGQNYLRAMKMAKE